jgi:ABC-2 type transport system permease protein
MKSATAMEKLHIKDRPGGFGLTNLWALYALTIRQHLHGKRWMVMTALFLLPAVLAIVIRATAPDAPSIILEFLLAFMFIPQALLPLIALVYASGIIQDEQEEQTLTYLLIRPLPKWSIYLVKLLATLTTTVVLTALFTIITYAAIYLGSQANGREIASRCLNAIYIHSLAVICYCCLFGLMSLLTKWTLVVGVIYTAVVEGLLANLPFGIRLMTVIYYTRLIAYRTLEFKFTPPGMHRTSDLAAVTWQYDPKDLPALTEHPSIRTCVIVLGAASLIFSLIAAFLCSRREFRVKTPEGN